MVAIRQDFNELADFAELELERPVANWRVVGVGLGRGDLPGVCRCQAETGITPNLRAVHCLAGYPVSPDMLGKEERGQSVPEETGIRFLLLEPQCRLHAIRALPDLVNVKPSGRREISPGPAAHVLQGIH